MSHVVQRGRAPLAGQRQLAQPVLRVARRRARARPRLRRCLAAHAELVAAVNALRKILHVQRY